MVYFVATPIGNLKDITYRAVDTLKSVDIIFCEDTRHSRILLDAYDIKKPLKSCHKFNEAESAQKIIDEVKQGKKVAIISDAGMPVISDPGSIICQKLREEGIEYTIIPGANAFLSALVLSALPADKFAFLGFLPNKRGEMEREIKKYAQTPLTLCIHCAPQDIDKTIDCLFAVLGERRGCAVREITKIHEEAIPFNLSQGLQGEKRGEYVLIVEGAKSVSNPLNNLTPKEHILHYMRSGMDKKSATKQAASDRGISRSEMYKYSIDIGDENE